MKCPHCAVEIHPDFGVQYLNDRRPIGKVDRSDAVWHVKTLVCPACSKAVIRLGHQNGLAGGSKSWYVYPITIERSAAPPEVPADLAEDYNEAGAVLEASPKASAALSRRCLQTLLRDQGFAQHNLAPAIDALLASKQLPSWLADNVDSIRNIGNFAAHPLKDTNTGAILPVEAEEAEWNLEVLEGLFDFYYVQPAKDAARRAAFNAKLQAAGKPPMKQ